CGITALRKGAWSVFLAYGGKSTSLTTKVNSLSCYRGWMEEASGHLAHVLEAVAAAARRLAGEKLVLGTAGNVSARAGDGIAITPTGARLESLQAEQIALVELDGSQTAGELEPSSELGL